MADDKKRKRTIPRSHLPKTLGEAASKPNPKSVPLSPEDEVLDREQRAGTRMTDAGPMSRPQEEQSLDDGPLAELVSESLRPRFARVPGLGWLRYTGKVWDEVADDNLVEAVRLVLREFMAEEIAAGATLKRINDLKAVLRSGKIRAVSGLLRGILEVPAALFDADRDLLNVANGVVDLRTGELHPHSSEHRFTKITKAAYQRGATSEYWDRALEALPPKPRKWMQARLGQALTGYPPSDDVLPVSKGSGANGKSTLFDGVRFACGSFAGVVPDRLLIANPGDHPTELTTLRGLRIAFLEELPEGARFSIKRLKDIVGTESITARKIAKDNITWSATHGLFITTNYSPRVAETDHGTWRRLALVRFPYTFRPVGEKLRSKLDKPGDRSLRDRMRHAEVQRAILAWLVEGAVAWYAADKVLPSPPKSVVKDTEEWRAETDLILGFANEQLDWDPSRFILASDLLAQFNAWLSANGHPSWAAQLLAERFGNHLLVRDHNVTKGRRRVQEGDASRPTRGKFSLADSHAEGNLRVWNGVAWKDS